MADTRGRQAVKITDPTTGSQEASVTAANNLAVDIRAMTVGTIVVDTELNAAAALADAASASVSTSSIGGVNLVMNATTLDRQRAVNAATDSTGIGIAAAGMVAQLDDTATTTVTENQYAPVRISTRRALLVEGVASGTNLNVALAASSATVTVDSEMPAAAALGDALSATTSTTTIAAVSMLNNAGTLNRAIVAPAADAQATTGIQASGLIGFNGTNWDRVRTANTGRLQVDVITGGGADTPTNPVVSTATPASMAAGASVTLNSAEAASKKLRQVVVYAATPFKAELQVVTNAVAGGNQAVGGGSASVPWMWTAPHRNYVVTTTTAGADNFRVVVTNLDNNATTDAYASFFYED